MTNYKGIILILISLLVLPLIYAYDYTSFTEQKNITFTTTNGEVLNNISVNILVDFDVDMQSDFSDVKFYSSDLTRKFPYWIEEQQDGINASIWLKINNINQTIFMVWGNPIVTSESNISQAFLFGDDFEDGDFSDRWIVLSTPASWNESGHTLNFTADDGTTGFLSSIGQNSNFSKSIIETKIMSKSTTLVMFFLSDVNYVDDFSGYYLIGSGYAGRDAFINENFSDDIAFIGNVVVRNMSEYYRWRYWDDGNNKNVTCLTDGVSAQGSRASYLSGMIGLFGYASQSWDFIAVREYISSEPIYSFSSKMDINLPIYPDVYVILNTPTSNEIFNITSITFNCSIYGSQILNLTLVINGTENITITNSTGNMSLLSLEQTYTLENGNYTWGCYGYSVEKTNSSYDSFEVNYTIPIIPPTPTTDTTIRDILTSSGAGIGLFFVFIARSLPILLIGIAMAGIIFIIGMAFAKIFKGFDYQLFNGVKF